MKLQLAILSLIVLTLLTVCNSVTKLHYPNGTTVKTKTYELNISDTNSILKFRNNTFLINSFNDSLLKKTDTIYFIDADSSISKNIFGHIDQVVIYKRNPKIKELYRFEAGGVYLVGYITADTLNPYNKFEPPLIILPDIDKEKDSTISVMYTFDKNGNKNKKSKKTKTLIELKKSGRIMIKDKEEECFLYELTISQDAIVGYGQQGLIVPDAISLSSDLLYVKNLGLIAEWGIRSRTKLQSDKYPENEIEKSGTERYLELTIYSPKKKGGT